MVVPDYRIVNNDRVTELFSFAIWQLRMDRIVRKVHNDRHSARHPDASQNAYHCERCVQSELSDMCYQLKTTSLVTLSLLTTLYPGYTKVYPNFEHTALTMFMQCVDCRIVDAIGMLREKKKSSFESWNNFKTDSPFTFASFSTFLHDNLVK